MWAPAEEIPEQSTEGTACLHLASHSAMCEVCDNLREDLFIEKETRLDELGNSQSIQTAKYAKIRKCTAGKPLSGEKAKGRLHKHLLVC